MSLLYKGDYQPSQDAELTLKLDMACRFPAATGGKFASLIDLKDDEMDIEIMITTITVITHTVTGLQKKERHISIPWSRHMFAAFVMRREI